MSSRERLLELAVIGLESERARIDQEIADLRSQIGGRSHTQRQASPRASKKTRRSKRRLTAEQKQAQSERMKQVWAERRRKASKRAK